MDNTVELKDGYCKGLQALKGNSLKVSVSKPQHLLGSVDIDDCTKGLYPNASRWDYAIGYDQKPGLWKFILRIRAMSKRC